MNEVQINEDISSSVTEHFSVEGFVQKELKIQDKLERLSKTVRQQKHFSVAILMMKS